MMSMNQQDYDRWWPLHLRASRGESMSDADRQFYADWLRRLQCTENVPAEWPALSAARRAVGELEQQQATLRARRNVLESEISAIEAALGKQTRQLLGVKE